MNEHKQSIDQVNVSPAGLVELGELVAGQSVNSSTAVKVLAEMYTTGQTPGAIVARRGLAQISDEAELAKIVTQILSDHPSEVADYEAGNEKLKGWFVGQVMRATRGQANPTLVNQLLDEQLAV
jgi:aspartyl-tRNA(Asn)/glutamyl-tRNA(Gln) amidotransferase subunit B